MSADQFCFTKEKLQALLDLYSSPEFQHAMGGRPFKGIVFTPGETSGGVKAAFGFGLFGESSSNKSADDTGTVIYPNTDPNYAGCPFPPGC